MNGRSLLAATLAVTLGGCFAPAPTVIVDLEDDKIIVQGDANTEFEEIVAEATEGCAIHGRKPVPISESCAGETFCHTSCNQSGGCFTACGDGCDVKHHLFACTE